MSLNGKTTWLVGAALVAGWACTSACTPDKKGAATPPQENYASENGGTAAGQKSDPAVTNATLTGPSDHRPVIVAFGDSLSAGYGADPGKSFPDYLQKRLNQANKNYRVDNAGVSGDTTTDGIARLPGILTLKPKIVILEFGGNDGLRGMPVDTTKENLAKLILDLQGTGAKVLLAGITLPRNYGPDYIHQFDAMYVDLADAYHVKRIPFLLEGVATDPKFMQKDGIHPTGDGNKKVADTVYKYLEPML